MNYTTNLNLKKPDYTDVVDINDINDNMDIIDTTLAIKTDWNESDSNNSAYIQNRTHYVAYEEAVSQAGITLVEMEEELIKYGIVTPPESFSLIEGAKYEVSINNEVSTQHLGVMDSEFGCYISMDNASLFEAISGSGWAFVEGFFAPGEWNFITSINSPWAEVSINIKSVRVETLDPRYLPENVLMGPQDWNSPDGEPGYIKNRTHYYEEILTAQGLTNYSDLMGTGAEQYRWFVVNGVVAGLVEGEQYKYTINERTYNNTAYKIEGSPHIYLGDSRSEVSSASSDDKHQLQTNIYDNGPSISVYLPGATDTRVINVTIHRVVLKKLDSKFLPDEIITEISSLLPMSGGTLETYTEKLQSTTDVIDLSLANVFTDTPTANRTYSITNTKTGVSHSFTLYITMGATVRTLTFPASVKWQGGEIPDLSTASKTYVLTFMTVDGGATWLGMFGGEF